MAEAKMIDPDHMPIVFPNGPLSVSGTGDVVIISFTQAIPRVEGQPLGKLAATGYEFRVVARIRLPQSAVNELPKLLQGFMVANAPASGRA